MSVTHPVSPIREAFLGHSLYRADLVTATPAITGPNLFKLAAPGVVRRINRPVLELPPRSAEVTGVAP